MTEVKNDSDKKMIYIVILNDGDGGVQVYPFADRSEAIAQAKNVVKEYVTHGFYKEITQGLDPSCLFCAEFNYSRNDISVEEIELDKDIEQ